MSTIDGGHYQLTPSPVRAGRPDAYDLNADSEGAALLSIVAEKYKLSARGYHRILRVARTIADLDNADQVRKPHIAEAASYRLVGTSF